MLRIAVIPGDGIGRDVTTEALKVLRAVSTAADRTLDIETLPYGAEHYLATGETILPADLRLEVHEGVTVEVNEPVVSFREMQKLHIEKALIAEHSNVARAAARLGMTRGTLYNKIKTFRIDHAERHD